MVEYEAVLKPVEPIDVLWGKTRNDDFVSVLREDNRIVINDRYRALFNNGATGLNDAPVLKALLYLLFNEIASSGRRTGRAEATTELWISILNAAAHQQEQRSKK
ncbi:hypothetical protein [Corynebacterium humireducens]|uniref:hypothetical protein n=1 Tax=Corynebacterium humireducens TaxID=1223514 RepID=UPI0012E09166|nr:hypothetical protein [Corynebacterium humireducens]